MNFEPNLFQNGLTQFADFTKQFGAIKAPAVDVEAFVAAGRKNVEAVTAANKVAVEGLQAVARRQQELVKQAIEDGQKVAKDLAAVTAPADSIAMQADLMKQAYEAAVANARELAELGAKSGAEAADVLNARVVEALDEYKAAATKVAA